MRRLAANGTSSLMVLLLACSPLAAHRRYAGAAAEPEVIQSACAGIVRNGEPFRAIGINYFDVFYHLLSDPDDNTFVEHFRKLRALGIPFVRFAANGFWPADNALYLRDKEAYFAQLDRVVHAAEDNGLGLVPTLFWNAATVPDLVSEPFRAWGDPRSRTHRFMRTYTDDVVRRYRTSPAIWMWEFGNEYNDSVDLPHLARFRPPVAPHLGTPSARSDGDDLNSSMLLKAYNVWAKTVRKLDRRHLISAGNNVTRHNAVRLRTAGVGERDRRAAWTDALLRQNRPFSVLSVHAYMDGRRFFRDERLAMPEMLFVIQQIAVKAKKPLFVGEFGATGEDVETGNTRFRMLLRAVEDSGVAIAAVWNFGPRKFSDKMDWNIDFSNEHAWMLNELSAANARLRAMQGIMPGCSDGKLARR